MECTRSFSTSSTFKLERNQVRQSIAFKVRVIAARVICHCQHGTHKPESYIYIRDPLMRSWRSSWTVTLPIVGILKLHDSHTCRGSGNSIWPSTAQIFTTFRLRNTLVISLPATSLSPFLLLFFDRHYTHRHHQQNTITNTTKLIIIIITTIIIIPQSPSSP